MRNTACVAALLALLCSTGLALADESKSAPCDLGRNAALTYWRAFAMFPEMTKEEHEIVMYPKTAPAASLEQRADLVKRWRRALELMHEAAEIPQCDWGIDYEREGFGAALPQLAKARDLAKAAAFRASYFWETGKRKEALDDLRAALIMAHQIGNDGRESVIAMLLQLAIEGIVQNTASLLLTDRESADMLANGIGDFINGPPTSLAGNSILGEKKFWTPWFRRMYSSDPAKAIADAISSNALQAKLRELPPKDVLQGLDQVDKQYDELAQLESLPFQEFLAKRTALLEKIKASNNPFAEEIFPGLTHVREEVERFQIQWAMVRAAIEIRREGESALDKVLNPADGKPFLYTPLEGGAFELKSELRVRDREIVMSFGRALAKAK